MPSHWIRRRSVSFAVGALSILVLAAGAALTGIAEQPFYTKGEPREAMVVWEMAHGGSLVLPLRNGTEIPSKPPFFHWLALVAAALIGEVSELTTRLPSAVLAIAAALAVYVFGASTGRLRSGWLAAAALVLSFEWLRAARIARVDMTLAFFLTGAFLAFAVMDRSGVTRWGRFVFYACVAAATLGKGPVGIVLPALVVLAYAAVRPPMDPAPRVGSPAGSSGLSGRIESVTSTIRDLASVPGIAAVLLVTGAWYAAALWIGGNDFFVKQVLKENVFRVLDPERLDTGHAHGPLYFVPNFFLGALPWSLLLPAVVWWIWRARPVDATTRYLIVWFLGVLAFFSVPASKRSVYILAAYPAAALLFGRVLGPGPEGDGPRRLAAFGFQASAAVLFALGAVGFLFATGLPLAGIVGPWLEPHDAQGLDAAVSALTGRRWIALGAAVATIAGAGVAFRAAPGAHWFRASAALTSSLIALYAGIAAPAERGLATSRTLGPFLADVRGRFGDAPLGFLCAFDYGAVFYGQRYFPAREGEPRCAGTGAHPVCRDHIRDLLDPEACRDPARLVAALSDPTTPELVLVWEDDATPLQERADVLMTSAGTGPKGRAHMLLIRPRRGTAASPTPAPGASGARQMDVAPDSTL